MAASRLVVVLCGPPGAGKTTAARESGLRVFDRDDSRWQGESDFTAALSRLARDPVARAVVIRSGASSSARRKAAVLTAATHVFVLVESPRELRNRVAARGRADVVTGLASVKSWFGRFDRADGVADFPGWDVVLGESVTLGLGDGSRQW